MFIFILTITISLGAASHTFIKISDDQYSPIVCERVAQDAAEQMKDTLSKATSGARIEIQPSCVRVTSRNI